jgi:hypothetical protein
LTVHKLRIANSTIPPSFTQTVSWAAAATAISWARSQPTAYIVSLTTVPASRHAIRKSTWPYYGLPAEVANLTLWSSLCHALDRFRTDGRTRKVFCGLS